MLVTIHREILDDLLDLASKFVSKNATLPILENIYLKGSEDILTVRATDMEKYVELQYPTRIDTEGVITVNAKTLYDFIKTIRDEEVELNVDESKHTLTIHAGKDKFTIRGIPGSEYVAVPSISEDNKTTLNTQHLLDGIDKVAYAVVDKSFTPVLTGILVRIKEYNESSHLVFTGSDSFRLAEYKIPLSTSSTEPTTLIIPKVNINDMTRVIQYLAEKGAETITMRQGENMAGFSGSIDGITIDMSTILIKGTFPDYENESVIPTNFGTTVKISTDILSQAIKKISILTNSNNSYVQCDINTDSVVFRSGITDLGNAESEVLAQVSGEKVNFAFNGKYVQDLLKHIAGDEVIINIADPQKPLVFVDELTPQMTYIVRPLTNP